MPMAFGAGVGGSLGGGVVIEDFDPIVWQCGDRVVLDEGVQPWRVSDDNESLIERINNYLFEGERYEIDVVVFDKNKIDDDSAVLLLDNLNTSAVDFENNCVEIDQTNVTFADCNARIGEESITVFDDLTMQAYRCFIDVQPSDTMYGEYEMSVVATSALTSLEGEYDEIVRWFMNPIISLTIGGDLTFLNTDGTDPRPGTSSYANTFISNDAEGGVVLDMFITGDDWPGANAAPLDRCWDGTQFVNYLPLESFSYYAENGAYSTRDDLGHDSGYSSVVRTPAGTDPEGYVNINQLINAGFEEAMFDDAEILQAGGPVIGAFGYRANVLNPGSTMSLTFRLDLPEPCYGEFESPPGGGFQIWGEAI